MRNSLVNQITKLAAQDDRIVLMTGDLGFGVVDEFAKKFPNRFINAGVAEQNMMGVATGLALEGKIVFVYSISNFPTMRCLEQIRNDACYHHANVKIISVGSGFSYGALGVTHHATEDIAVMRVLPEMKILSPSDPFEAAACADLAIQTPGPVYIRVGKGGEPKLHSHVPHLKWSEGFELRTGKDYWIVSTGSVTEAALKASDILKSSGIELGVFAVPTIKPLPEAKIRQIGKNSKIVFTLEEHTKLGGLGGIVAEILAAMPGDRALWVPIGSEDRFYDRVGDQDHLRKVFGMDFESIVSKVKQFIQK